MKSAAVKKEVSYYWPPNLEEQIESIDQHIQDLKEKRTVLRRMLAYEKRESVKPGWDTKEIPWDRFEW